MKHVKVEVIKLAGEVINDLERAPGAHIWTTMLSEAASVSDDGEYTFHYKTTLEDIEEMRRFGIRIESETIGDTTYHRIKHG